MKNYIKEKNILSNLILSFPFLSILIFLQDVDLFLLENTD